MNSFARPRRLAAALGLAAVLTLAAPPAQATIVVPLSRQEMVDRSDLIVRASVIAQQSAWNADHSQIVTHTRLRVDAWLKGSGSQELVLEQFGGRVDGLESHVSGDASLSVGQQAVLFLRAQNGLVFLQSLAQSVYYIETGASGVLTVRRDLTQLSFARQVNGQYQIANAPLELSETLEHLAADVTRIARGGR